MRVQQRFVGMRDAGWGPKSRGDVGYEKYRGRDRASLISIGGMRDSFEIDSGMRDLNSK